MSSDMTSREGERDCPSWYMTDHGLNEACVSDIVKIPLSNDGVFFAIWNRRLEDGRDYINAEFVDDEGNAVYGGWLNGNQVSEVCFELAAARVRAKERKVIKP